MYVLLRETCFFDGIYTHVYGKTKFRKKMYLRELSGSKFHSVIILYNDVKNSIFIKNRNLQFMI